MRRSRTAVVNIVGMSADHYLEPDWPAPATVRAVTTLRRDGASAPPYDQFNLADHVGDDPAAVAANRQRLYEECELSAPPAWLHQVHGTTVVDAGSGTGADADGSCTTDAGVVCAVLTADCLPVVLCDRQGTRVAALHAGWRGLAAGVIEAGVAAMQVDPGELMAWCGPAIGPRAFEVGDEVRSAFVAAQPRHAEAFVETGTDRWLADIYLLARQRLAVLGVTRVHGAFDRCTWSEPQSFFSYRRDRECGRMATLIWRLR
jgi:YfiH family protein